jgi:hypothetical protein
METYIYLATKITVAAYILYKVWNLLFRDRLFGLWDRIPVRERKPASPQGAKPTARKPKGAVIGRTNIVLLDDPRKAAEPVATTDLAPTGFIGQEEPMPAEDVDGPESPEVPSQGELYEDAPPPDENEMSASGTSFEEMSDAADVLVRGTTDNERRVKAAKTLHDLQNTEIFDFLAREVCSSDAVESLLKECLDGDGFPLKKRNSVAGFDMSRYV